MPAGNPSAYQSLYDQVSQQPQGNPNDLIKFIFTSGEFTNSQKELIKAWMQNPAVQADMADNGKIDGSTGAPAGNGADGATPTANQPKGPTPTK